MRTLSSMPFFLILVIEAFSQSLNGYEIKGRANGVTDNTVLYLEYTDGNFKMVDSTRVSDGRFYFSGNLKLPTVKANIRTGTYSDFKFFWLENGLLEFSAEKGKFREATITGSKTQNQQNDLDIVLHVSPPEQRQHYEKEFVRQHPASIISAAILKVYCSAWGKNTTIVLYEKFSSELKASDYGKDIAHYISVNRNLKVGDRYVDFSQKDRNDSVVSLSDFDGKIILLEFWGSWCGPCRASNPKLLKVYNEFKNKGFEVLGVGAETKKEHWLKAIESDHLPWPNVTDWKGDKNTAALIYGVSSYPSNFLIDHRGIIIGRDLDADKLRKILSELLP